MLYSNKLEEIPFYKPYFVSKYDNGSIHKKIEIKISDDNLLDISELSESDFSSSNGLDIFFENRIPLKYTSIDNLPIYKLEISVEEFRSIIQDSPLYVSYIINGENYNGLVDYSIYEDSDVYILPNDNWEILEVFFLVSILEDITVTFNDSESSIYFDETGDTIGENVRILSGSNKENLVNYKKTEKVPSFTTIYESLTSNFDSISSEKKQRIIVQVDFEDFSKHVRFGSAKSKVINAKNKFDRFRLLSSESEKSNEIEAFTMYERWLFVHKYSTLEEGAFTSYMNQQIEESDVYDIENPEFIWYSVSSQIMENDSTGYFSNFLLLMGEIFDYYNFYIQHFDLLKSDPHYVKNKLDFNLYINELVEMGMDEDFIHNITSFDNYYSTENNSLKSVTSELTDRLLHSLPFLYQSKGSYQVIDFIFNIFGIPKNLLEIVEFGGEDVGETVEHIRFVENNYYLNIDSENENVSINVTDSQMNIPWTIEIGVNNIRGTSGSMVEFGNNKISFVENDGAKYKIQITADALVIYTSGWIPNNSDWTYIGVTYNDSTSGKIWIASHSQDGDGISFKKEDTFGSTTWGAFTSILIGNGDSSFSISNIKIYTKSLSDIEFIDHYSDLFSVSEDGESTLIFNHTFVKTSNSSVTSEVNGSSFNITYNQIDEANFFIDEFHSISDVTMIGEEFIKSKVNILGQFPIISGRVLDKSEHVVDTYPTVVDESRIGIFLSYSDKVNKFLLRHILNNNDLIPNVKDDNMKYRFESLENQKKILYNKFNIEKYSDLYYYRYIRGLISKKIFNVIKKFVPSNVDLEYGLLLKNNFLNKNKTKSQTGIIGISGENNRTTILPIVQDTNNQNDVHIIVSTSNTISQIRDFETLVVGMRKINKSTYLNTISTIINLTRYVPHSYFKQRTKTFNTVEKMTDAGASIEVI